MIMILQLTFGLSIYLFFPNNQDTAGDLSYVAPARGAEHLAQKLKEFGFPNDACILDLGSGTGLVGERLHKLGYTNIDGVDISPESLEVAREKAVYRRLTCGYMASNNSEDLGIDAKQYDAAICIGVFTVGHVKSKGFDDLVHVVKPGGLACFTIRDCVASDPQYGYDEKMNKLCMEKKWRLVSKVHEMYHDVNQFRSWLYTYQIL